MRFLLTEKTIKISEYFEQLLLNAQNMYERDYKKDICFITEDILLIQGFESSLNGSKRIIFYSYYFFDVRIYNDRLKTNKAYDILTNNSGLMYSRFNDNIFIANVRGHYESDTDCRMMYLAICSNNNYSLSGINEIYSMDTMEEELSVLQDNIIKFTLKAKNDFIKLYKEL